MKTVFGCLLFAVVMSCTNNTGGVKDIAAGATEMGVQIFNSGKDSSPVVYTIKDAKLVKQMAGYMDGEKTAEFKCGYDGNVVFFKKAEILFTADFKTNDVGCMHFSYMLNGALHTTVLSPEAQTFIQSLQK
jgi:hypothetical protein